MRKFMLIISCLIMNVSQIILSTLWKRNERKKLKNDRTMAKTDKRQRS